MARGRGRPPRGSSTPAAWWFVLDEFLDRAERVLSSEMARDFVYGDLLHADPGARRRLRGIPEDERLLAAAVWVADATRLTLATKQLILELRDAGLLTSRP